MRGSRISHAHNVSKRVFKPNLHSFWMVEGGHRTRKKFCTKCLRKVKKEVLQVSKVPQVSKAQNIASG